MSSSDFTVFFLIISFRLEVCTDKVFDHKENTFLKATEDEILYLPKLSKREFCYLLDYLCSRFLTFSFFVNNRLENSLSVTLD